MKGLILKDIYVLHRQMRLFAGIILLLCVVNEQLAAFAIMYAAMLPYTAMAYDEQSRWNQLAAMTPCRPLDIVLSKYILGWLLMAGAACFSILMNGILGRLGSELRITTVVSSLALACICLAVLLPIMFRFGVEKGRMGFILIFVAIFTFIGSSAQFDTLALPLLDAMPAALAAAAAIISAVSVPLAAKLYQQKGF